MHSMVNDRLFSFAAVHSGPWVVSAQTTLCGEALPQATHIRMEAGALPGTHPSLWVLQGVTSNERYLHAQERKQLASVQEGLGRSQARCAALIPIRKNAQWWVLSQDERREIFEAQSRHIQVGAKYLPPIARKLHHCRDLGHSELFDFITWFEFAAEHASFFDDMLVEMRASPEWAFVDGEVDIRLFKAPPDTAG